MERHNKDYCYVNKFTIKNSYSLQLISDLVDNMGTKSVINALDPIEELYDLYSEEEETLWIIEMLDDGLGLDLDLEDRLLDLYLEL